MNTNIRSLPYDILERVEYFVRNELRYSEMSYYQQELIDVMNFSLAINHYETSFKEKKETLTSTLCKDELGSHPVGVSFIKDSTGMWTSDSFGCGSALCVNRIESFIQYGPVVQGSELISMYSKYGLYCDVWAHPGLEMQHIFGKFGNEHRYGSKSDPSEYKVLFTKPTGEQEQLTKHTIHNAYLEGSVNLDYEFGMTNITTLPYDVIVRIRNNLSTERDKVNLMIASKFYTLQDWWSVSVKINIIDYPLYSFYLRSFCDVPNGFCYLKPVKMRFQALWRFGFEVTSSDLIHVLKDYSFCDGVKFRIKSGYGSVGHIVNPMQVGYNNSPRALKLINSERTHVIDVTSHTLRLIDPDKWMIDAPYERYGSTGGFDMQDLLNSQPLVVGYYCPDPELKISQGKRIKEPKVSLEDNNIIVESENIKKSYNIQNKDIGKVRHEYVASKLMAETDLPLSILGVQGEESVLTPDVIDVTTKKVLELGTSKTSSLTNLHDEFNKKKIKYDYLLQPLGCNIYYLIVGYNAVVTNLLISDSVVDDLCARFRIGIQLETKITELIGFDLFSGYNSEDVRIAKAIFSTISMNDLSNGEHFNIVDICDVASKPNQSDIEHSREIMSKSIVKSIPRKPHSRELIDQYLNKFPVSECKTHKKRITNIPMIHNSSSDYLDPPMDANKSDLPNHLKTLWMSSSAVRREFTSLEEVISQSLDEGDTDDTRKHKWKRESIFKPKLSNSEQLALAQSGVGAKKFKDTQEVIYHEKDSKKSFYPFTDTSDIKEFVACDNLKPGYLRTNDSLIHLIYKSKSICSRGSPQLSVDIWKKLLDMRLISFFDQCSEIFTELSYNYKHWTVGDQFMIKETKSGIKMIIKNSGTHLFVSFGFPKLTSKILDTGRLGPLIYTSDNYYFTDFCSFNEPTLEHFVKSGPYMTSLLIHLMSNFEIEPGTYNTLISQHFNLISLLYLNNKTDSEELMTSQRYLFMKLFEDATQDPYIFTDRLPEVLRSRLTSFLLMRTISLMDYYSTNRIIKIPKVEGDVVNYNYLNIRSIINDADLSISQKINEFYYGYVISKERGRGSDRNFKIVKKILQEEYRFRDSVKNIFEDMSDKIMTYSTDPQLLRVFLHIFQSILKDKIGDNYKTVILEDFLQQLSFTNFTQLATLKASARNHEKLIQVPENLDDDRTKILRTLNILNKDESQKRPKVLEALMTIVKQYKDETKHEVRHMMQLIPWCLKILNKKGYFDSDIFPKPQHGGDREIHVLEITARIVQFTLELISKTICKYFMSETITHPETKSHFVKNHYKQTSNTFKSSFTMSKSADASKWCQRHHVSHFASLMVSVTPKILHGFILKTLKLWTNKKISFPLQLSATLLANKNVISNPTFERFRDEFFSGTGIFDSKMSNKITIKSGMMQGILHYTSSLYHTMIQEVMKIFVIETARRRFKMNVICSVVQGSDDSGMMLGVEGKVSRRKVSNCYILFRMKEEISQYLSVYWNVCKSSLGTIDLIEYNSEWFSRMRSIKPTFRWVSACMELSVTERFIDRIRIFNQVLTQCLEGGATTLECAVIQLNQAWLHYIMLGLTTSVLSNLTCDLLLSTTNPQLGFFPFDYDISCGIPGIDCQLYNLSVTGNYIIPSMTDDRMLQYEYEGQDRSLIPKDLRSVKLKFGRFYLWTKMVERINLGTLEDAIDAVQKDPMKLFGRHTSWDEEVPNLLLKIFSPGVKESINNISSTLRMVAASAYILHKPCLSVYKSGEIKKKSLYSALVSESRLKSAMKFNSPKFIRSCFPMHEEYEQFLDYVTKLSKSHATFNQTFTRTNKDIIKVFEVVKNETDLIDLCKRKWNLGGRVTLSSRQFDTVWSQSKLKFPFLKDTISETATELSMNYVELKLFLESLVSKERKIILQDTTSKYGGIESAMTRIYWPNVKIRSEIETNFNNVNQLRSQIFSVLTFWYSDVMTTRTVQELIQTSKFLRKEYYQLPIKSRKLKTIFDWANDKNKVNLIQQIQAQKQGRVGFFTNKQRGWGNNLIGEGEWRGQVLGVPCIIKMRDNTTDYIKLRNIQDYNSLGRSLSDLLDEFKCNCNNDVYSSSIYLSKNGKITAVRHQEGRYIPVILDPDLSIDVVSSMEEMNWSFETKGTTIRLVLNDNSLGQNRSYTILSDSYSQKDWNPLYNLDTSDLALNNWCNNQSVKVSLLEAHLDDEIPSNFSDFLKFNAKLEKQITNKHWSLIKLRSRLLSNLIGYEEANTQNISSIELEPPLSSESMLEIHQLMRDVSLDFDFEFHDSNISWADEVLEANESVELFDGELTSDIENSIRSLIDDLDAVYTNPDREEIVDTNWMKMSISNKFFSNINVLCEVQCGEKFLTTYNNVKSNDSVKVKGLLGKIMSLMLRKHVYDGKDTHESLADLASESSRQADTIMSEKDLTDLDINNLDDTINQLEGAIKYLKGTAKSELERTLNKYKRLRLLKMSPVRTSDIEDIDYGLFMTIVVNKTFQTHRSRFSDRTLADNLKLSLMKVEMIDKLEQLLKDSDITNHEFTLTREYINKNVVSHYLIQTLNVTYGYNITLSLFNQTRNFDDIEFY